MHRIKSRLLVLGLVILAAVGTTLAIRPEEHSIENPKIQMRTAEGRRQSLAALEDAWNNRALVYSEENAREERMFLNRLAYFVRSTQGRETYSAACRFWNQAYHDHSSRYSDFIEDTP